MPASAPYISTIAYAKFALAVVAVGLAGNLVISFIAARSMAGGLGRDFISSGWHREYDFRYVIALSTMVVLAEFLVLNLVLHAILSRHLIPITALVCASAAAWLPERTWSPSVVFAMVLAFALSAVLVCYRLTGMDNLHRFADLLAAEQRKCSGFKIIPIDMFALGEPANSVNGQTRALASRFGQLEIAREFGFALASSEDRVMDPRCGGAVWFVPAYPDQGATAVSLLDALNVPMDRAPRPAVAIPGNGRRRFPSTGNFHLGAAQLAPPALNPKLDRAQADHDPVLGHSSDRTGVAWVGRLLPSRRSGTSRHKTSR